MGPPSPPHQASGVSGKKTGNGETLSTSPSQHEAKGEAREVTRQPAAAEEPRRERRASAKRTDRRTSSGTSPTSLHSLDSEEVQSGRQHVPTYSLAGSPVKLDGVLWVAESLAFAELSHPSDASPSAHAQSQSAAPYASASRSGEEARSPETGMSGRSSEDEGAADAANFYNLHVGNFPLALLVHQYTLMGGQRGLVEGKARILAARGIPSITFNLRGAGASGGRATFTGSSEVNDTVAVCEWAKKSLGATNIFLIGTSAGAPISGSAVPLVPEVKGWVGIGYTFGFFASLLFSRHFQSILENPKPKLFVHAGADGFTSTSTFEHYFKKAAEPKEQLTIDEVGHFELEGPYYDPFLCRVIFQFVEKYSSTPPLRPGPSPASV
ncbi:hypothetical protein NCLIV_065550 [Neospora caninum Liverpool]|uniref:Xaa-Pro dipeptidyl-peptidase-like domain-containing protein n=1 Tax=Neospora caninum (strain Liverpool) TaxID=572307 RepID=F0VQY2_NEOCL|nr:hypothetical protein NCLIV_065550 [Neospora caninum Liverpool]CBZ56129.1 hypothetical protein NCLIV_065550 [Neospora caninum Liverpool]|eukprot:XP_003886155.1 hypothetical protein NCLIV_065550 [Neospora caninum Liverpool]